MSERPTYLEILYALLCTALNIPCDWVEVNDWCVSHRLLARVIVKPEHLLSLALTTNSLHRTGDLTS